MEVWHFECKMLEVFSQEDIPNIRVKIVNDLLFSKHNIADVNIVKNFNANVSFSFLLFLPFLLFFIFECSPMYALFSNSTFSLFLPF